MKKRKTINITFEDFFDDYFDYAIKKSLPPRVLQEWKLLNLNELFIKDIQDLKIKWKDLLEEFINSQAKTLTAIECYYRKNKIEKPTFFDFLKAIKNKEILLGTKFNLYLNKKLEKDFVKIARKHKLNPINIWVGIIRGLFFDTKFITNPIFFDALGRAWSKPNQNKDGKVEINVYLPNGRFEIKTIKDKLSGEERLSLILFKDCAIEDIKNNWDFISSELKKLKGKNKSKRHYHLSGLEKEKMLVGLDKKKYISYYDPISGKYIKEKMTDAYKAVEIYGDFLAKKRKKHMNRIKNIRYRHRKRFK